MRDSPAEHPGVSLEELALIDAGRPAQERPAKESAWRLALNDREVLLLTASSIFAILGAALWLLIRADRPSIEAA